MIEPYFTQSNGSCACCARHSGHARGCPQEPNPELAEETRRENTAAMIYLIGVLVLAAVILGLYIVNRRPH